jgi:hypothetical protein
MGFIPSRAKGVDGFSQEDIMNRMWQNINHNPVPPDLSHYFEDLPDMTQTWTDAEGHVWVGRRPIRTHSIETKVTLEAVRRATLKNIMPILIREVRNNEEFFEYVDGDPATANLMVSFEIEYLNGERRPWDDKRDPDFVFGVYLIVKFTFELPPL